MSTTISVRLRRDTAANWSSANPILAAGQPGYDTTNRILKIGDGVTAWNSLNQIAAAALIPDADYGDITVSGGGTALTVDSGAITLAKMAGIATARFIGRTTAGTGVPEALTGTQATALLDTVTTSLKGLAPASGGGTTNFLRADGTWAAPASSAAGAFWTRADVAPPTATNWTWVNQGGATRTDRSYGLELRAPASSGNNLRILTRAAPTPPYTITARLGFNLVGANFPGAGIGFRASGAGTLNLFIQTSQPAPQIMVQNFNSPTSYNSAPVSTQYNVGPWFRITDDNTNRIYQISRNGDDWVTMYTVARTTFLTPDQVILFVESNNATYDAVVTLYSWEVT